MRSMGFLAQPNWTLQCATREAAPILPDNQVGRRLEHSKQPSAKSHGVYWIRSPSHPSSSCDHTTDSPPLEISRISTGASSS